MDSEVFKCDICFKLSDTLKNFNRHRKTHSKPFRCEACPSRFALRSDLERHVRARHRVGNDQYRCRVDQCQFKSNRKDHLKRHTRKFHFDAPLPAETVHIPSTKEAVEAVSVSQIDETIEPLGSVNGIYSVSVFMQAAVSGDITTLDLLMDFGFTTETRADDQSTALHCAARSGQARTVQYLLKRGASCEAQNDEYRLPLHEAILSNDSDTVKAFFQHTSEIHRPRPDYHIGYYVSGTRNIEILELCMEHRETGFTPAHVSMLFRDAIYTKNDTLVAALLVRPDIDVNSKDYSGRAPLHHAAQRGNAKIMSLMLASDRIDTSLTGTGKELKAIHIASRYGNIEVVEQLLSNDNNDVSCRDREGYTSLHHAAFTGHWKAVHLLLQHTSSTSHCDRSNKTTENEEFVKKDTVSALLNHAWFFDPNSVGPGWAKGNLLQCAVKSGDDEVVAALLAHEKINVNQTDRYGNSPLPEAACRGHIEILRLLLQHPQIDVNQTDRFGCSPLCEAACRGHIEILRLLLQHPQIDVNQTDRFGCSPLYEAACRGHIEILRLLLQHPQIDVNIKNIWAGTPLQNARRKSHQEIIDLLLSHGAIDDEEANAPPTTMETSNIPMAQDVDHLHDMDLQPEFDTDPESDLNAVMDDIPA